MKELTPFIIGHRVVTSAVEIDPEKANPITPMVRFGILLPGAPVAPAAPNVSPNHQVEVEAETPAEDDPKAAASSVIDSASLLHSGTGENGQNNTDPMQGAHPSTLPVLQVSPANVEKELNPPLLPPIQIG